MMRSPKSAMRKCFGDVEAGFTEIGDAKAVFRRCESCVRCGFQRYDRSFGAVFGVGILLCAVIKA